MTEIENHIIENTSSLREALSKINRLPGGSMTLFVIDEHKRVIGSLTDGDIRRGLLSGASLETPVEKVMNKNFLYLSTSDNPLTVIEKARKKDVSLLPRLSAENNLVGIIDLRITHSVLPLDAVLMAGGKGLRMRPLTLSIPKPLLPVGGIPIIDHNIALLQKYGIRNIFATVNYKKEMIEEHFISNTNYNVVCVAEPKPLGTFGSLTLVDGLTHDNVIVMNADLYTDIDFEAMYRHHISSDASLTIAAVPYSVSVPYAILHTDSKNFVSSIDEKPTFNYFANAGVYILQRDLISLMEKGERLDAPDFIEMLLTKKHKIAYYPIEGTWTDIGSPDDYRHICEILAGKSKA